MFYPAIFTLDDINKSVGVRFPDVPEAITFGSNFQDAYHKAKEVLIFALEDYDEFPEPSLTLDQEFDPVSERLVLIFV